MKNIKNQVGEILPYIAVLGLSGIAAYAAAKVINRVKNITISLDVGDDPMLKSLFNKDTSMTRTPDEIKRDEP